MSLADYYIQKCEKATEDNVKLLLAKLADPASLVDVTTTGALANADSLGDLASLAGTYIENNAGALTVAALGAAGLQNSVLGGLNLFMNLFAQAVSAYNDLILLYMKKLAEEIVSNLQLKITTNQLVIGDLTALVNAIISLNKGPAVFDAYLEQLRAALILIDQGRRNTQLTRDTLAASNIFLTKTFRKGRGQIFAAQTLIKPLAKNPYLQPTIQSVALNLGIPDTPTQIGNILGIPKLCKKIITDVKNYGTTTLKANAEIVFYFQGLQVLQNSLPDIMKKMILSLFNNVLQQINALQVSMGLTLNGHPGAVAGPVGGFTPVPLKVSVTAFKWMLDINLIANAIKLIPADIPVVSQESNGQILPATPQVLVSGKPASQGEYAHVKLGDNVTITSGKFAIPGDYVVMQLISSSAVKLDRPAYNSQVVLLAGQTPAPKDVGYSIYRDGALATFAVNEALVAVYTNSVAQIQTKNNRSGGGGTLLANQGQENFAIFQGQLITYMAELLGGLFSSQNRLNLIAQGRAFIAHCNLSIEQDTEIINILNVFINTPIPLEATLNALENGLSQTLKNLGLDKAADLLKSGDFASFFASNGKNATYVGAALEALALLKACFPDQASQNQFNQIQNQVAGEQDLLNIKITFNFDLAIAANIAACTDFLNLAKLFNTKEFLCGLASAAGVAAQAAGAAVAGAATSAAGAISAGASNAFAGLEDLVTFPDSPPANQIVPAAPAGVVPDLSAAGIAAAQTV